MKRTINGLIFGNDKKQCKLSALIQLQFSRTDVTIEFIYFRKVRNRDLFEYSAIITIK